jgi:hypothetical protein
MPVQDPQQVTKFVDAMKKEDAKKIDEAIKQIGTPDPLTPASERTPEAKAQKAQQGGTTGAATAAPSPAGQAKVASIKAAVEKMAALGSESNIPPMFMGDKRVPKDVREKAFSEYLALKAKEKETGYGKAMGVGGGVGAGMGAATGFPLGFDDYSPPMRNLDEARKAFGKGRLAGKLRAGGKWALLGGLGVGAAGAGIGALAARADKRNISEAQEALKSPGARAKALKEHRQFADEWIEPKHREK